jgi:uncharacterized protein YdbL (DUF1318 family)
MNRGCVWCVVGLLLVLGGMARADARKEELQKRFEARYPVVAELKSAGTVGETTEGLLEPTGKGAELSEELRKLVAEENADRNALYALIAEESGADLQQVARRAAMRNFEKARPGEWLKSASGEWKQKG